jgi:hypothetical protein
MLFMKVAAPDCDVRKSKGDPDWLLLSLSTVGALLDLVSVNIALLLPIPLLL